MIAGAMVRDRLRCCKGLNGVRLELFAEKRIRIAKMSPASLPERRARYTLINEPVLLKLRGYACPDRISAWALNWNKKS
jgi:hypothetical protein